MITDEEAHRRVGQFWKDLQTLEFDLVSKGWRDAAKAVYGARLHISEARDALPLPRYSPPPTQTESSDRE